MKDKFKKFVRQHWIFIWALLSVVYAAIVQLLFSLKTSNQFFVAHWGAGDILTYASTISLGLLAMVLCQDLVQVKMRNFSPF
mgnify:CR=1 FL=1